MSHLSTAVVDRPTEPSGQSKYRRMYVGEVFENFPLTREHLKSCLALFFVFAIEAWEMMIIVYTSPLISQDFHLDPVSQGNLIGAMFIGMLAGALGWGKISDRFGRKRAIAYSLLGYGLFSLASAFAPNYPVFYVLRFLSGMAAVGMMIVTFAHFEELLPVRYRGPCTVYLASGWPIGMLLALGVSSSLLPYGWRTVIALSSFGGLWAIVIALWVQESPYWLASVGRQEEARKVLSKLSRGAVQLPRECTLLVDQTHEGKHRELFSSGMRRVSFLQIAVNFTFSWGYWGLQTWLPTLLQQRGLSLPQSYSFIAWSAVCMIPGYMVASYLTGRLGRKKVLIGFISGAVVAGYGFANSQSMEMLYLSNFALAFFSLGAWGVWGTWVCELYPTPLRTLGYSWAALAQRIANVIAPTLIGMLVAYGSSFNMTTTIINMFMVATLFLVAFIPETEGKQLH